MKESVKITVIAAGFREVAQRRAAQRPSYLPKTWKTGREQQPPQPPQLQPREHNVPAEVVRKVSEVIHEVPADDLDVPTFLRRQAQKA